MSKDKQIAQEQTENAKEAAEFQNQAIRDFVEERAADTGSKGPVNEHTTRLPDNQNRMITQHNRQM
ncbi:MULTISPECIES: hypothetical protein [unclassified Paenibacillus]|uniref:hypothetical protein n=1 Tax=unclassified Paenibacillus TaxID=185978 RepID=UPI002405C0AB|nr:MULTISPECIES: hypothetical protein [unclassified Paenibacillus]MDF9840266.1 uncharacterized protein HemY [Paenibacillus sp. PastF-2]MDF9846848.1 uncharacterized protein HemY [Paenibacillus sp. PastM-2]MDF9853420.1 uncharacterized protein HemY [Paenibacillus sp. PastF-1]MDH6479093.1 uncharacterized protein HemY [Paenibacillus sp. PastH-2]MDH6506824.1 uncharacterized protein HemY [Paenibacillus sp. PastM-3]